MIAKLLLIIFYILAPAAVLWVCRRVKVLNKIGPVLTLYILGVVVANIGLFPTDPEEHKAFTDFQDSISSILVPLALPMMLFGCNFKKFSLGKSLGALIIGTLSVRHS